MTPEEELRLVTLERDMLLKAVTGILDGIGDLESGKIRREWVREKLALWDKPRVFCTCKLPGLAVESSCRFKHAWR